MDAAYDALRKKGLAAAAKKASRHAADGLVGLAVAPDHSKAAVVEINSETDFVGRSDLFRRLVAEGARAALALGGGEGGAPREAAAGEVRAQHAARLPRGSFGTPLAPSGGSCQTEPLQLATATPHQPQRTQRRPQAASPAPAPASPLLPTPQLAGLSVPSPSSYSEEAAAAAGGAAAAAARVPLPDACAEVAAKVRENVRARRAFALAVPAGGAVGGYVHNAAGPGVGRIAVAVAVAPVGGAELAEVRGAGGEHGRGAGGGPRGAL